MSLNFESKSQHRTIKINTNLTTELNNVLERENAGYLIIDDLVTEITDPIEVDEILASINHSDQFEPVSTHLKTALAYLSDRDDPDYRNSIKESISAVESMASIYTNTKNVGFAKFMRKLEAEKDLHSALTKAFIKMYGYASDDDGIRHSLTQRDTLTKADARYFLVSCSAFTNYIKALIAS